MIAPLKNIAVAAAVISAATGQSPAPLPDPGQPQGWSAEMASAVSGGDLVPIHTADADGGVEYGLWAAGDRYKASFHGDMTFIPYLGSDYPTTQSLVWRTTSVRVGGTELLSGAAPTRSHTDYRFEYQHGAVTEAYDVRVEGLEQTFVIHKRPATHGDLVVRGAVAGTLTTPRFDTSHGELVYSDASGAEILRYGEAYAFDASGRKTPITTAQREGVVELTVPAEWLAGAHWPVTVDPLISVTGVGAGFPHRHVDIVRDEVGNDVMVCFCKGASTSDQDAYVYLMSSSFTGRTLVYSDVTSSWNTEGTACATAGAPRKYCVVFSRRFTSSQGIRCHMHDSNDFNLRTNVVGVASGSEYNSRPDVGGAEPGTTFSPTGQNFMIVWQRDSSASATNTTTLWGRTLATNGTFGTEFPIAFSIFNPSDYEDISICQQSRRIGSVVGSTTWMVVYQRFPNGGPTWRVEGRLVSDDPNNQLQTGYAHGDNSNHRLNPKVAGVNGRYLVAFTHSPLSLVNFKTASDLGHNLKTQRVDWTPGNAPVVDPEVTMFGQYSGRRMILGGVAYDSETASHWAVTSGSSRANGGTGRTIINRLGFNGRTLDSVTLQSAPGSSDQGGPGGVTYNSDNNEFLACWEMNGPTVGRAWAARYTYPSASTPALSGISCATATPSWSGSQQIGSEFSRMLLTGAVPNQFAWLLAGTQSINVNLAPQGMPGCALLVPNTGASHVGIWTEITNGSGSAVVDLPLAESLNGIQVYFQWFYVEPGANSLDLVSTQRLRVQLSK